MVQPRERRKEVINLELVNKEELLAEIDEAIANIAFTSPYQDEISTMISGMERIRGIVEDALAVNVVLKGYCPLCNHHIVLRKEEE